MAFVSGIHPINENLLFLEEQEDGTFVLSLAFANRAAGEAAIDAFRQQNIPGSAHWERVHRQMATSDSSDVAVQVE